jgi:hypothetical protein
MVIVKANKDHGSGRPCPASGFSPTWRSVNEELNRAGVCLAGEGLHPSSKGVRVKFDGKKRIVTDGPVRGDQES